MATGTSNTSIFCRINGNKAASHGGGISTFDMAVLSGGSAVLRGNTAGGSGGCIYVAGEALTLGAVERQGRGFKKYCASGIGSNN